LREHFKLAADTAIRIVDGRGRVADIKKKEFRP